MVRRFLGWMLGVCVVSSLNNAAYAEDVTAKIKHIVVIVLENHSFDNIFGHFPGAEGLANAKETSLQTDKNGAPYKFLPPVMRVEHGHGEVDTRFPKDLQNQPFLINTYVGLHEKTGDLTHRFYQQQQQINGGKMDRFAAVSGAGGLVMGYFEARDTRLWRYASKYMLLDHFFHAAFGGSFLNHAWLICACTPRFENAPDAIKAVLDEKGHLIKDGLVTPDGYAVGTMQSINTPHAKTHPSHLLPSQTMPTIGDRLSEKHISWAWYAGGWDDALAGKADPLFQFHHQPFVYFANFADGTSAKKNHLKDENDFLKDIKAGTLPAVSFYKPLGEFNLHPAYATMKSGDAHLAHILEAIEQSPVFPNTVVVVTFDENGGYWDHVVPPVVDRFGPGMRIPTLIISPLVTKHKVDHKIYDTTSILKMIETVFALKPLTTRDASARNLLEVFEP